MVENMADTIGNAAEAGLTAAGDKLEENAEATLKETENCSKRIISKFIGTDRVNNFIFEFTTATSSVTMGLLFIKTLTDELDIDTDCSKKFSED